MFSSIAGILTVSYLVLFTSLNLPSAKIMRVVVFVMQEIGGAEGDRWWCRRMFNVVPLKVLL